MNLKRQSRCRLTTYSIEFAPTALKEWRKLDAAIRDQFARKLRKIADNPHVPSARVSGGANRYRLKLRKVGYRLGYQVFNKRLVVVVIGVGRRDKGEVYEDMADRWHPGD